MGLSVASQMAFIRQITGVCPQHNLVYDTLTCREHLELLGAIKGLPLASLASEVERWVDRVGLQAKLDSPAGQLSGGQKRKLSVAMAMIGIIQLAQIISARRMGART